MTTAPDTPPPARPQTASGRRKTSLTVRAYQVAADGERTELLPATELGGDGHPAATKAGWPSCQCPLHRT